MQSTCARQDLDYPNGMGSADNGVHNIFWSAWLKTCRFQNLSAKSRRCQDRKHSRRLDGNQPNSC